MSLQAIRGLSDDIKRLLSTTGTGGKVVESLDAGIESLSSKFGDKFGGLSKTVEGLSARMLKVEWQVVIMVSVIGFFETGIAQVSLLAHVQ